MTINKIACIILIAIIALSCKPKQPYQSIQFENPYKFDSEIREQLEKDTVSWKHQIAMAEFGNKGDYNKALKQWDIVFTGKPKPLNNQQIDSIRKSLNPVSAISYITQQAQSHQVVIINEAHHNSSHRVFTESLLLELYEKGFKNLGLEALSNSIEKDSLLNERGYPSIESGYYIKDPSFGNLVRTALDIGFNVFSYEQTSNSNGKEREIEQARNIQNFMEKHPEEKVLIHCGFDHVLEGNYRNWGKTMAGRIEEFTGVNPLTINQTKYSERSEEQFNEPILNIFDINEPSVLIKQNGSPLAYQRQESFTDISVIHPISTFQQKRANWLYGSEKKSVEILLDDLEISFPIMVLAYFENENFENAVPTDIIEIKTKKDVGYLVLSKGNYSIIASNADNQSRQFEMHVK